MRMLPAPLRKIPLPPGSVAGVRRAISAVAGAWLVVGSVFFLHGAITGNGVAAFVFGWEFDHGGAIWPTDIYAALLVVLIVIPLAALIGLARSSPRWRSGAHPSVPAADRLARRRVVVVAGLVGMAGVLLAALAYGRTLLLPTFAASPVEIDLGRLAADADIAEGQAIVLGIARLGSVVTYEEANGGGKTSIRRRIRRFVPLTSQRWQPGEPVRIVAEATTLPVQDAATQRFRPDREGDASLPVRSTGILLAGQVPGFVKDVFARRGVTLAPGVLMQTSDRGAGREGWYVAAALLGLVGVLGNIVAVAAALASSLPRGRDMRPR